MNSETTHLTILIDGNLKESGIRFSALHEAYKAGVNGIIKYTTDGSAYIEVEGKPEHIAHFKTWCIKVAEKLDNREIKISTDKLKGYTEFIIKD